MQLKDLMMVLVVISIFAFCVAGATYSLNSQYNTGSLNLTVVDDVGDDMDNVNAVANSSASLVSGGEMSAGGYLGVIFNSIGNFLKGIFEVIFIPFKWIASAGNELGIPKEITYAFTTLLLIAGVFAVISAILRKNV